MIIFDRVNSSFIHSDAPVLGAFSSVFKAAVVGSALVLRHTRSSQVLILVPYVYSIHEWRARIKVR